MRAVQMTAFGGPEVLDVVDLPSPEPGDGQVVLDVTTAGINYADTHQTENTYLSGVELPCVPGGEVVGHDPQGRRHVALLQSGGYAERALAHPALMFPVPDGIDDLTALALTLQGVTAWHLLRTSARLQGGESVVVHAGAGGVGSLAVQLARMWGADRVIATASTEAKRAQTLELGADVALDGDPGGLRDRIVEANDGNPVDVVLEMVGGPTFHESLQALAPFGRLVTYGAASRLPPAPVDPLGLMQGSRAVVGFWMMHCTARPDRLVAPQLQELFELVEDGRLQVLRGPSFALTDARRAHEALRSRATSGKLVLDPAR